jgi:hypothetical protein
MKHWFLSQDARRYLLTVHSICEVRMMTIIEWLSRGGKLIFGMAIERSRFSSIVRSCLLNLFPSCSALDFLEEGEEEIAVTNQILHQPVFAPFR